MQTVAQFMNKQPDYDYFKVNEKRADVFIYEFIEEIDSTEMNMNIAFDEDGNRIETEAPQESHVYSYRVNIFTVNPKEITEEMIKENPMKYMNYDVIKSLNVIFLILTKTFLTLLVKLNVMYWKVAILLN